MQKKEVLRETLAPSLTPDKDLGGTARRQVKCSSKMQQNDPCNRHANSTDTMPDCLVRHEGLMGEVSEDVSLTGKNPRQQ